MAIKYGGKYVDSFLKGINFSNFLLDKSSIYTWLAGLLIWKLDIGKQKTCAVFDFLEAHFQDHKELVIQLVSCIVLRRFFYYISLPQSTEIITTEMWIRWKISRRRQEHYRLYVLKPRLVSDSSVFYFFSKTE